MARPLFGANQASPFTLAILAGTADLQDLEDDLLPGAYH